MERIARVTTSRYPALAALVFDQCQTPSTQCIQACSGETLQALLDEMQALADAGELTWVAAWDAEKPVAAMGAEFDPAAGRSWLRGPFARRSWSRIVPRLWDHLREELPAEIVRHDAFSNLENRRGREFYAAAGFAEMGRAQVYEINRKTWAPASRRPGAGIGPLQPEDVPGFTALHDRTFPTTFITGAQIAGRLDDGHRVWIARDDGQVAGYLFGVVEPWSKAGYVEFLAVDPAYRGRGLGGALLDAALRWFFTQPGVEEVGLTVEGDNDSARGLYVRSGFRLRHAGINQRLVMD